MAQLLPVTLMIVLLPFGVNSFFILFILPGVPSKFMFYVARYRKKCVNNIRDTHIYSDTEILFSRAKTNIECFVILENKL